MKILFISTYPLDLGPSQRFRVGQYLPLFEKAGHEIEYSSFYTERDYEVLYTKGNFIKKAILLIRPTLSLWSRLFKIGKWDRVFIQRETSPIGPPLLAFVAAKVYKKKIIYDLDDSIWLPNFTKENAMFHRLKAYWKVKYMMSMSRVVIAGNEFIAEYARKYSKDVRIIPTVVDTQRTHCPLHNNKETKKTTKLVLGWTGSISTLQHLETLGSLLIEIQKDHDCEIRIIANKKPEISGLKFTFIPWSKENEINELRRFDIGLMPLPDNEWTRGKCGFKAIQYMSLGIPAVISPVGMNTELIEHEVNGFLCSKDNEWRECLKALIGSQELRQQIGEAGRKTIIDQYSVLSQWPHLKEAVTL